MPSGSSNRRIRTAAVKAVLATLSSSGSVAVPYGRGVIKVTGVGAPGSGASGGGYWYSDGPQLVSPASQDGPVLVSPAVYTPASTGDPVLTSPAVYTPSNYTPASTGAPVYASTFVERTDENTVTPGITYSSSTNTSNTCPAPYSTGGGAHLIDYTCTDNYTAGPTTPASYTPSSYTPAQYTAGPTTPSSYTPAQYTAGPYHPATYTPGADYYYPYVPASAGANAYFGGVTFPGGYGGPGTPISLTTVVAARGSSISATVPTGATITVSVA